jgi:hypothetical protein
VDQSNQIPRAAAIFTSRGQSLGSVSSNLSTNLGLDVVVVLQKLIEEEWSIEREALC